MGYLDKVLEQLSENEKKEYEEEKQALREKLKNMSPEARGFFEDKTGLKADDFLGEKQKESITINGKKYRAIKESVESKKHLLREMYERIGGK